ncbi:hypothetical protein LTR56_019000 [Elasticomyces elasticus]|nr:hypothetical protein LTR56_019000 [Elasticomyces elasticus]KAK3635415.1 hypothetical protein LTR22_019223 [Elasticomyces elasticus]KAK4911806.1 hypothetical protein LTR49_019703 [Elasticomyces elasticus]KAK5751253.1 hypothetical protein LTS12_018646 [Elasticomyces elasticus]
MYSPSLLVAALAAILPSVSALNITVYRPDVPLVPSPLPPSHAQTDGNEIISLFQTLGRNTIWKSIANISFEGDTYEPEGMVRLVSGDVERFIVSAGEYMAPTVHYNETINGTDRSPGAGFAHLVVFDGNGSRIADATLTPEGALQYHNGGIDFDGQHIWCTIAQYRPNATAYVARVDPTTMESRKILQIEDHQGGVVHDVKTNNIYTLNWGSRNGSTFNLNRLAYNAANEGVFTRPQSVARNPSYFVDYQDCKFMGHSRYYHWRPIMLCSGVWNAGTFNLGGIALVDANTMVPVAEVPIQMTSFTGYPVTQNPVEVAVVDGKLRLYLMPDQHNSTLFVYEAEPGSPFQFGGTGGAF